MKVDHWWSFIAGAGVGLVILSIPHLAGIGIGLLGMFGGIYLLGKHIRRKREKRKSKEEKGTTLPFLRKKEK